MKLVHRVLSACLGLSLLALGGCGGDEAATSDNSSSSSSSSGSTAPAAPSAPGGSGGTPGMNASGMMPPGDMAGSGGSGGMNPSMMPGSSGGSDPATMGAMDPAMMAQYGNAGSGGGAPGQPKQPKKKPEEWTELDITAGIEQRDPEVVPAIDLYSDDKQGEEATSQGIVTWLAILSQPKKEAPKAAAGGSATPGSYPGGSSSGAAPTLGSSSSGSSADPATDASYIDPAAMEAQYNGAPPGAAMSGSGSMMPGGQQGAGKKTSDDRIAEALIDALIETHTLVSYQAARDILRGDLKIGIDIPEHKVAGWTMASLLKHQQTAPDPAAKILRQALLNPEQFRSGGGDFDASRLENQAVLEHVAGAIGTIDGLMGLRSSQLSASSKQNQNQMYGGGGAGMDPAMMAGPGGISGAPGEPGGSGGPPSRVIPEKAAGELDPIPKNLRPINFSGRQALAAREYLWNPELVKYVHQGLSQSDSLMKNPELVLLAGQLPVTETRQDLRKFLTDQWEMSKDWTRNPAALIREQVFAKHMRDPGLLVTLKSLPRMAGAGQNQGGGAYAGAPGGSGEGGQAPKRKSKYSLEEEQAMQSWNRATSEYMLALMDRAKDASQTDQHQPHNGDELDVRLHRDAQITADFRLELVLGNPPPEGEIDLRDRTVLNYVRIESNQMDEATVRHYKSVLKKEDEYPLLNGNVLWLDYSGKSARAGEYISIDVLLSKSGSRGKVKQGSNGPRGSSGGDSAAYAGAPGAEAYGSGGGGGQDFVVEILTVRIPDPTSRVRQVTTAEK